MTSAWGAGKMRETAPEPEPGTDSGRLFERMGKEFDDLWRRLATQEDHPERTAETTVDVDFTRFPRATLTHEVRLRPDDPVAVALESGKGAPDIELFVTYMLGRWAVEHPSAGGISYDAVPAVSISGSSRTVRVSGRWDPDDEFRRRDRERPPEFLGVRIAAPRFVMGSSAEPVNAHRVTVRATGGRVAGLVGTTAERRDGRSVTFTVNPDELPNRVAVAGNSISGKAAEELGFYLAVTPSMEKYRDIEEESAEESDDGPRISDYIPFVTWPVTIMAPWLLIALAARRSAEPDRRMLAAPAWAGIGLLAVAGLPLAWGLNTEGSFASVTGFVIIVGLIPIAVWTWARRLRDGSPWRVRHSAYSAAAATALTGAALMWALIEWREVPDTRWIIGMAVALATGAVAGLIVGGARYLLPGLTWALWTFAAAVLSWTIEWNEGVLWPIVTGLIWSSIYIAILTVVIPVSRTLKVAIVGFFALALLDVGTMLEEWPVLRWWDADLFLGLADIGIVGTYGLVGLTVIMLMAVLLDRGERDGAPGDPLLRRLAVALMAAAVILPNWNNTGTIFAVVAVGGMFSWLLLPRSRLDRARRLSGVSRRLHARMFMMELRGRLLRQTAQEFFRTARGRIAKGELTVEEFDRRDKELGRTLETVRDQDPGYLTVRFAAFNSGAGHNARANGRAALRAGLIFAIPLVAAEAWAYRSWFTSVGETSVLQAADLVRWMLRPAVAAFLFGYFYPLLRGDGPLAKALLLLVALMPAELFEIFALIGQDAVDVDLLIFGAGRIGQLVAFTVALGLYWERRIVRAAGLPWSRLRDFRSMRSLVTPVTAVLVAAGTALTTALASAAMAAILEDTPRSGPEQEATPTPTIPGQP